MDEQALADALERSQADERLPAGTAVRDLGWHDYENRHVEVVTAYAPPLIKDGRDHDHLRTPVSFSGAWEAARLAEKIGELVDRHLEEWQLLVAHAGARPFECEHVARAQFRRVA